MNPAGILALSSAGLDIVGGAFGYLAGQQAQEAAESRARLILAEAEADAQRYAEEARKFKGRQSQAYTKSGVYITGSALDMLDETSRIAEENIATIRARGRQDALAVEAGGAAAANQGRSAFVSGVTGAGKTVGQAYIGGHL